MFLAVPLHKWYDRETEEKFMITEAQIQRINELARKAKTSEGLTEAEKEEQQLLRRQYIEAFKANLRSQLDNIEFVDEK